MKQYNNPLTKRIQSILVPLLGESMAMGVIKKQAEMLGTSEETLELKHMPQMADNIQKGLSIFLGNEKAQQISNLIREAK
ncbi:MAG: hypothetical protein QM786_12245 [Breznakibacter sp.]